MTASSVTPAPDLTGQVALVTGASAGLGRHFASTLARAGASVAIAARRKSRLAELTAVIEAEGGCCLPVELDVTDPDQIASAVHTVREQLGVATILVNNAGVSDAQRAHKMPLDVVDAVLDTNIRGPYLLACAVARQLIEHQRPGRIVNLSSAAAYHYDGSSAATLYSITKAAIVRMTEVLAVEWLRYGINVNAIAPGLFHSEMTDELISRVGDPSQSLPRSRIGLPSQLDTTLYYLVDPSSDFVTGTTIRVDDGQVPR